MIIITEDSKSGFDLWKYICKYILVGDVYLCSSEGIGKMKDKLKYVIDNVIPKYGLRKDIQIVLVVDNPSDNTVIKKTINNLLNYIENIHDITNYRGNILVAEFSCTEEIILSYRKLKYCVNPLIDNHEELYLISEEISDSLLDSNKIDFNRLFSESVTVNNIIGSNYENSCLNLLKKLTNNTKFKPNGKSSLGICWCIDCNRKCNRETDLKYCFRQRYHFTLHRDLIHDLYNNSVLSLVIAGLLDNINTNLDYTNSRFKIIRDHDKNNRVKGF